MCELPNWIIKQIDLKVLTQKSRYTTKHTSYNHVAIIYQGRKIIAIGQNKLNKRHKNTETIHAEVDAIHSLGDISKLRGAVLVVVRISSSGLLNSKPCVSCEIMLQKCVRVYGLRGWKHS